MVSAENELGIAHQPLTAALPSFQMRRSVFSRMFPPWARVLHQHHVGVLDVEIILDAERAAFTAEPALLDAAERRLGRGERQGVDADHAGLHRLRGLMRTLQAAGEDIAAEADL